MRPKFVHPPRTGGSSIVRAWGPTRGKNGEYRGHRLPEMPKPDSEFRYGFTRNPWDRAVSLYYLANPHATLDTRDFQKWVVGGMDGSKQFGPRWEAQVALPTLRWLAGANFIGRFESRDRDLVELAMLLGREVPREHIAATPSRRKDYREYYDEASKLYVAERYFVDIDAFGYEFDYA